MCKGVTVKKLNAIKNIVFVLLIKWPVQIYVNVKIVQMKELN